MLGKTKNLDCMCIKKSGAQKLVLAVSLLTMVLPALATADTPGAGSFNECCIIDHKLDALSEDTTGVDKGTIICPPGGQEGSSNPMGGGNGGGNCPNCDLQGGTRVERRSWGAYCLIDTIYTITDWIFWLAFIIGGLVVLFGGIQFMFSQGNPEKTKKAGNAITFGIVGMVLAIISKLVPLVVRFLVK